MLINVSAAGKFWHKIIHRILPVLVIVSLLALFWYVMTIVLNSDQFIDRMQRAEQSWSFPELVADTMAQQRPVLPAPHQIMCELYRTIFQVSITSVRSLIFHSWITLSSTLLGFMIGSLLGITLAIGIVHIRSLDKSLLPWIISSQTIPILAIAPMIIVVLAAIGLKGLIPKSIISAYLCFFPVTIGMVKGLRSPQVTIMELLQTYRASTWQILYKLRLPASLPFLFTSLKIAISASLVGAIVGELPTGASAGLGARLLAGSYYGQTIQIWSALILAATLAALLVQGVGLMQRLVLRTMGAEPG